jgi:hypothetical protein
VSDQGALGAPIPWRSEDEAQREAARETGIWDQKTGGVDAATEALA